MVAVNVRSVGFEHIKRKLFAASKRGGDNSQFADYVAARAYKECLRHFDREEGPEGKWKTLSPVTIAARRKGKGGGRDRILQDTGRMKNSILYTSSQNKARVICNMEYGYFHQNGVGVPERRFLWVSDEFLVEMSKAYTSYIKGDLS